MTRRVIVVKVGTSTLLGDNETPSKTFDYVADSLRTLMNEWQVVLVTSGAIGFGVRQTNLNHRPQEIHRLQALSMIGQVGLLRRWREAFTDVSIGQVLVTRHDLEVAATTRLFHHSVAALWEYGAVPIINENDAVSTEEISFGDNDRLAAEIAVALEADTIIFLTDQDGIQADFMQPSQHRLSAVRSDEVDEYIHATSSSVSRGGASSKVEAARIALAQDIRVFIAHAGRQNSVEGALAGKAGTEIVQ